MQVLHLYKKSVFKSLLICLFGLLLFFASCGKKKSADAGTANDGDPAQLARKYMSNNQFDEAEAAFIKAIQVAPNNISNYGSLARLYILQKNYAEAENQVKTGLKINADDEDLGLLLAKIYILKGDKSGTENELKQILAKNPKNGKAWYNLAALDPPGAGQNREKTYLIKALSAVPANIIIRLKLAQIYAGSNKADSARFYLEGIKKITPNFSSAAGIVFEKAASLLRGNHAAEALPYVRQFDELMKTSSIYASDTDEVEIPLMVDGSPAFTTSLANPGITSRSGFSLFGPPQQRPCAIPATATANPEWWLNKQPFSRHSRHNLSPNGGEDGTGRRAEGRADRYDPRRTGLACSALAP